MIFVGISILAGIFTVVSPCILPLLPIVIGASQVGERKVSGRALRVIVSLKGDNCFDIYSFDILEYFFGADYCTRGYGYHISLTLGESAFCTETQYLK